MQNIIKIRFELPKGAKVLQIYSIEFSELNTQTPEQ